MTAPRFDTTRKVAGMEPTLTWTDPPPLTRGPTSTKYLHIFNTLRENPGQWAQLVIPDVKSVDSLTHPIKNGKLSGSAPAGSFDAVARTVDGEKRLYVRYVGTPDAG